MRERCIVTSVAMSADRQCFVAAAASSHTDAVGGNWESPVVLNCAEVRSTMTNSVPPTCRFRITAGQGMCGHRTGSVGVTGSSPVSSTRNNGPSELVFPLVDGVLPDLAPSPSPNRDQAVSQPEQASYRRFINALSDPRTASAISVLLSTTYPHPSHPTPTDPPGARPGQLSLR